MNVDIRNDLHRGDDTFDEHNCRVRPAGNGPADRNGPLLVVDGRVGLDDKWGSNDDLSEYLRLVSQAAEELLDVAAVGCLLSDRRGELLVVAWSSDEVLDLERRELRAGQGPGVDCYATGEPVVNIGPAEARRRWPTTSSARPDAGFASRHALPLRAGGRVIGVLSLYFLQSRELTTHELLMCQTLIHVAGTRLRQTRASRRRSSASQPAGERYQVSGLIGHGGMADVHLARDIDLDRVVAIKTPRTDRMGEPGHVERFRREGRTGARLEHPGIVSVMSTGDGDARESGAGGGRLPYIVMEHVSGVTLRTLVGAGGGLKVDEALRITGDILGALTYTHEQGVVHGDLTATNVMLAAGGAVKVMDFGSSHTITESDPNTTQSIDVTPAYGSPERVQGLAIDTRADLYSVGCVLYELLTGRAPFVGDSPVDLAYRHVHEVPQPPSTHRPEIRAALDAVVLRALAKAPGARYQSALEFRVDLLAAGFEASRSAAATLPLTSAHTTPLRVVGTDADERGAGLAPGATLERPPSDEERLDVAVAGLSQLTVDQWTVREVLTGVAQLCQRAVPGATGVSLRLLRGATPDTVVGSTQLARELDALQYRLQEGPCLTAVAEARTVLCDPLDEQQLWPGFRHGARHLDIRSVLALPLLLAGQVLGTIILSAPEQGAFSAHARTAAERFAHAAAPTVRGAQLLASAHRALPSWQTPIPPRHLDLVAGQQCRALTEVPNA